MSPVIRAEIAQRNLTDSTEHATPPKSTNLRNSNFSVQIQIKPESQFGFVPRNAEKTEFFDAENFGGTAFSVESVVHVASAALMRAYT